MEEQGSRNKRRLRWPWLALSLALLLCFFALTVPIKSPSLPWTIKKLIVKVRGHPGTPIKSDDCGACHR